MTRKYLFGALVLALVAPVTLIAGDFDGSKPLICAVIHATEAGAEEAKCLSGPPWMVSLSVFIEVDFEAKNATTTRQHEGERVSEIELVDHLDGNRMSLQGTDGEHSWSMVISEQTGSMTLAVAGEEVGFLAFGACTAR